MKRIAAIIIFCLPALLACASGPGFFNVRDFGAAGDGVNIDSRSVNEAIIAASSSGGGTVYFPAGIYSCYSIRLKDNVNLYLDRGAVIRAAVPAENETYDLPEPNPSEYQDFGHSHWQNSLIWGIGLHDVSILGFGLIDGTDGITRGQALMNGLPAANKAIALKECRNVTVRDISMLMCGHFAMLFTGVDNLTIDNVKCDTNRDAFDIDCCSNVIISNCLVNSLNDDGIVLKSSYALGYSKATENVSVINCQVSGYDPGTLLDGTFRKSVTTAPDRDGPTGRIKLGTESNGGFKNICISNCVFDHCRGIALETVDGGVVEDVIIDNIVMRDICNAPIYIRLGNRARGPEGLPVSAVRRVKLSNIVVKDADSRYASVIFGLENHPIEDVTLSNVHIQYRGGLSMDDVRTQKGSNSFFAGNGDAGSAADGAVRDPFDVPQQEKGYPEPSSHGILPSYGLFISHARGVTVDNVVLETLEDDGRPAIVLIDVDDARFSDMKVSRPSGAPFFVLRNVRDVRVRDFDGIGDRTVTEADDDEIR